MVTVGLGYVGASVILQLRHFYLSTVFVGIGLGYFALCLKGIKISSEPKFYSQIYKDVRDDERTDFDGFDTEIHLVAVSNDLKGTLLKDLQIKSIANSVQKLLVL